MTDQSDITITLPKLGESIMSATIAQWFKKVGDEVTLDEPLLEVSTDKVNSEIPSPVKGVIKEILAEVDQTLDVGAPLCVISTSGVAAKTETKTESEPASEKSDDQSIDQSMKTYYSPSVLRLAQEKGISMDALAKIKGTGAGGRITKHDLENYSEKPKLTGTGERVSITGMRKAIADAMVRSSSEIPHATLIDEVDITDLLAFIAKEKEGFKAKHGCKLTITAFVAKAIAQAAREFPTFNSTFDGSTLLKHAAINVGIAVSLEKGLMVPVIRGCCGKSLPDIAKSVGDLSSKARNDALHPDDVQGGTITMTNFGMGGALIGFPIINHPQVAIIGLGAIKPTMVPTEDGKNFTVRQKVHVSCTFDHRVIDGMEGCNFLASLKKHLEQSHE